jgi:antitoxin HigA-1
MPAAKHPPVAPGQILREEFVEPLGLNANQLALALRVPATRITDILRAEKPRTITADTAFRLARYFGTTAEFWMNLQAAYELACFVETHGAVVERDVRPREAAA